MWEGLPLGQITPWGALLAVTLLVIGLVVRGKLVPKVTVDSLLTAQAQRLEDRDTTNTDLTEANRALTEAVRTLTEQSNETLEFARSTHAIMSALHEVVVPNGGPRGPEQ